MDGKHLEVEVVVRIKDEVSQFWRESFQRFPEQMETKVELKDCSNQHHERTA